MGLDLRIPLGLLFLTIGGLLLGYGCLTLHSTIYLQSMGQNVNVIWGAAMMLFGGLMFLLAWRARAAQHQTAPGTEPLPRRSH